MIALLAESGSIETAIGGSISRTDVNEDSHSLIDHLNSTSD
jgi:hypothetical protein